MTTLKQHFGKWLIPRLPIGRRAFDILRFELNAFTARLLSRIDPRMRRLAASLARQDNLRVNLGSGGDPAEGWINIDVHGAGPRQLRWDIRERLPFAESTVALVYASHVVEHLEFREETPALLQELHRVVQPGGGVRIVVPDAARFLEAYVTGDGEQWAALGLSRLPADMPTPMAMVNHIFSQNGEHQFGYDFETLALLLKNAGFDTVARCGYRRSSRFDASLDLAEHASYSLYVEAAKAVA
jgi:predicted SAM-dependent methyltransferase